MAKEVRQVAQRVYWREAEGRVLVEAWQGSGETLSRFARRYGIAPRRLARWVKRLEGAGGGALQFHPVRLVGGPLQSAGRGPIEIELAGGQRVRVGQGFQAEDLRRVLAVLAEASRC